MNHIQVVGTHNSYHREITLAERKVFEQYVPDFEEYYYSQAELPNQLSYQYVRSLELDLHSDVNGGLYYPPLIWKLSNLTAATDPFDGNILKKPGIKVFHITDVDTDAVCHTLVDCLTELKTWSDANPTHVPILIDLELKTDIPACGLGGVCADEAKNWTLPRILNVDAEILSVLNTSKLIRPDDIRVGDLTLEQSILQYGWPRLDDVRGRFMFYFDNDPTPADPNSPRELYIKDAPSLQNRTVFTNSIEGQPDCAFIKMNDPTGNNTAAIQQMVQKNYIVRTMADASLAAIRNSSEQVSQAFNSGAQIVSTNYPSFGMSARWGFDYVVTLGEGRYARCNPVNAPATCQDGQLE